MPDCLQTGRWLFPALSVKLKHQRVFPAFGLELHHQLSNLPCRSWDLFSSVAQSCLTLCDPLDCSTPGFLVHHQLPELTVCHVSNAIQPSHPVIPFSYCLRSFPASGSFLRSQFFASGGQSIGASASASVLPMNIQDGFPLGWSGLISLLSKGHSRAFSQHDNSKSSILWCSAFLIVLVNLLYGTR